MNGEPVRVDRQCAPATKQLLLTIPHKLSFSTQCDLLIQHVTEETHDKAVLLRILNASCGHHTLFSDSVGMHAHRDYLLYVCTASLASDSASCL